MIFLERPREGHRQSDGHWNRVKGSFGETSERRDGAHMGFSVRLDTILNRTELNEGKLDNSMCSATKGSLP